MIMKMYAQFVIVRENKNMARIWREQFTKIRIYSLATMKFKNKEIFLRTTANKLQIYNNNKWETILILK